MINALTSGDEQFFRSNYRDLMRQSRVELSMWKKTRNVVFLQQSCEKIFNALEQFTSIKSKLKFESHSDFRSTYRKLNLPKMLLPKVDELHRFFYNGEAFEKDFGYIEKSYLEVYSYLSKQNI